MLETTGASSRRSSREREILGATRRNNLTLGNVKETRREEILMCCSASEYVLSIGTRIRWSLACSG